MTPAEVSLLPFWEWIETIGWFAVILGCTGEGIAEFTKWPKDEVRRHKLGKISWLILIAGLALEFWASGRISHIKDTYVGRLNKLASEGNERAAKLEKEAEQLKKENLELFERIQPRRITKAQRDDFIIALKDARKEPVLVFLGMSDPETGVYAEHIRAMLDAAGYGVSNRFAEMIYNDRLAIDNTNPALKKTFVSVLFYGEPDTRFVASGTIVYTSSTNQQYILSAPTNTHTPIPAPIAIELAFKKIGVPTDVYVSTNTAFVTKPGDWGILVKPKY